VIKLLSSTKDWNGVYELVLTFDGKKNYTYFLTSEFIHRKFCNYLKKGMQRKALRLLKNFNKKEMFDEGINTKPISG
jgi:hypothetical protein